MVRGAFVTCKGGIDDFYAFLLDAFETVLPYEQPERKGEWLEVEDWNGDFYYECSECKEPFVLFDGTPQDNLYNYCPNCGADMRGEEE